MKLTRRESLLIQSDSEEIAALVGKIAKGDQRALKLARRLNSWVYKNIEKRPFAGMPSALDVLAARQGDCNEHAMLLAALSRVTDDRFPHALGLIPVPEPLAVCAVLPITVNRSVTLRTEIHAFRKK